MEWEFTAQEVVRGEVGYGLEEFRRDLCEELRTNVPGMDDDGLESLFRLVYDLHYWLATGNAYRDFEMGFRDQPTLVMLLRAVHGGSAGNVEMLGAILQRTIMDGVEAGANLEEALQRAGEAHRAATSVSPFMHYRGVTVAGSA